MKREALELMEKGWRARENYKFDKAEELLTRAWDLFKKEDDWSNVVECLNHLAYLRKVQSFRLSQEATKFAKKALEKAKEKKVQTTLAERANSSVLKYAGEFEKAEKHTRTFIENTPNDAAARADMRGDLAYILMRRGRLAQAQSEIELALAELEKGWEKARMPHRMIWKTKLLMYQSLIKYNSGEVEEAKQLAGEALKLSQENQLQMRQEEATTLLELFDTLQPRRLFESSRH